jgi:hypothetical protein
LPKDEAAELEALVVSTRVFDETATPNRPLLGAMRDHRSYTLDVEDGTRSAALVFSDPVPAHLSPLVQYLRTRLRGRG